MMLLLCTMVLALAAAQTCAAIVVALVARVVLR
jgi:hypothetical protein